MASPQILSTVIDLVTRDHEPQSSSKDPWWDQTAEVLGSSGAHIGESFPPSRRNSEGGALGTTSNLQNGGFSSPRTEDDEPVEDDPELKLPDLLSLFLVIGGNAMSQISFFIIVSSANAYAEHLGGSSTFSGLTIGVPAAFAAFLLIPMVKYDQGRYKIPMNFGYAGMLLGNILYGLAYRANYLYLILIGRIVSGLGFTSFMYFKRYCSDPRIVGVRRRTTLASWLVVAQGFGFSGGPFLGGLFYKIGFSNKVFNGYTSPGWMMAIAWTMFLTASLLFFKDVKAPKKASHPMSSISSPQESEPRDPVPLTATDEDNQAVTREQWGVIFTMMWYAMTCFFILGAWESNIPVFTASIFHYNPYQAGNFIALGGIATFPFLLLNVWYSRRVQDRVILAFGSTLGLAGLIIMLITLLVGKVTFGSFYVCWFLVALGFNLASTCTLSLLSKQFPASWNGKTSMAIQYSNFTGRICGAVWGGAGVQIGMLNYVGVQIAIVGIGALCHLTLWRQLKAKTG